LNAMAGVTEKCSTGTGQPSSRPVNCLGHPPTAGIQQQFHIEAEILQRSGDLASIVQRVFRGRFQVRRHPDNKRRSSRGTTYLNSAVGSLCQCWA
jgi:hypothetical protein